MLLCLSFQFYLSHFRHPERQGEREHYLKWLEKEGYEVIGKDKRMFFEGGGDAVFSSPTELWAGFGYRTQKEVICLI